MGRLIGQLPIRGAANADAKFRDIRRLNGTVGHMREYGAHQRLVCHRSAHHSQRVDAPRVVMHAERVVIAIGRFVPDTATECAGPHDRPAGLRAKCDGDHIVGHGRGRAAG